MKITTIPWNPAQAAVNAAGGVDGTVPGSLFAERGLNVKVVRVENDSYDNITADFVKFGEQVKAGVDTPTQGAAFGVIMGDAGKAYLTNANAAMAPLGQKLKVIYSMGYSRGEDKCMVPAEVAANKQLLRGLTIAAVPADGDIHICIDMAAAAGVPFNGDEKTYDPDALNIMAVDSYSNADLKVIAYHKGDTGGCENRPVIRNGKLTSEKKLVCPQGTATWFPGDKNIADQLKGKLVSGRSTKDNIYQMTTTLIGNDTWMQKHPAVVENLIAALAKSGEQLRNNPTALRKSSDIMAKIMNEFDGEYWFKAFNGYHVNGIEVGGSTVNTLADNVRLFGLDGKRAIYQDAFEHFGGIDEKYFPSAFTGKPISYADAVDTRYLAAVVAKSSNVGVAATPTYVANTPVTAADSKQTVYIEFDSGKASLTASSLTTLEDIRQRLAMNNFYVQLVGHTDSIGDPMKNMVLSKQRADTIKMWLIANGPSTFSEERLTARGAGDTQPIASNTTEVGRSKNRRVEIVLYK